MVFNIDHEKLECTHLRTKLKLPGRRLIVNRSEQNLIPFADQDRKPLFSLLARVIVNDVVVANSWPYTVVMDRMEVTGFRFFFNQNSWWLAGQHFLWALFTGQKQETAIIDGSCWMETCASMPSGCGLPLFSVRSSTVRNACFKCKRHFLGLQLTPLNS